MLWIAVCCGVLQCVAVRVAVGCMYVEGCCGPANTYVYEYMVRPKNEINWTRVKSYVMVLAEYATAAHCNALQHTATHRYTQSTI